MIHLSMRDFHTSLDPYIFYQHFNPKDDSIFLDSSKKDSSYSQYSIMGLNPFLTLKLEKGQLYEKKYPNKVFSKVHQKNVFTYLNQIIQQHSIQNTSAYPFIGGGMGYFSYEFGKVQAHIPSQISALYSLPEFYFVFYDNVIIFDTKNKDGLITGLGLINPGDQTTQTILQQLESIKSHMTANPDQNLHSPTSPKPTQVTSDFTRQNYIKAINQMRSYMEDGHIYVANMTHTFHGPCSLDPTHIYRQLRHLNPAPFSAYLAFEDFHICCSSPERFIQIRNQEVQTRPIKGTVPRNLDPIIDKNNRRKLEMSTKDKAELLMIVDLERNDLSRVCQPHSVKVPELFKIEAFSSVYHLVSTVVGRLRPDKTSVDCFEAVFPGGSITGAPKIRAMEIIEEVESTSREIYTGSIGYFGFDGGADFNIVIRSIVLKDKHAYIGVGGGITHESNPAKEFQETLDKGKNLFQALNAIVHIDES